MPTVQVKMYKPIPAKTYLLLVKGCKEQKPKAGGDPFLSLELEVVGDEEQAGKTFSWPMSFNFGKGSKSYKFLLAVGFEDVDEDFQFDTDVLLGQQFYAEVAIEEAKSGAGPRNTIKTFWSIPEFELMLEKASKLKKPGPPKSVGPTSPLKAPVAAQPEEAPAEEEAAPAAPAAASAPTPAAAAPKKVPLRFPAKQ